MSHAIAVICLLSCFKAVKLFIYTVASLNSCLLVSFFFFFPPLSHKWRQKCSFSCYWKSTKLKVLNTVPVTKHGHWGLPLKMSIKCHQQSTFYFIRTRELFTLACLSCYSSNNDASKQMGFMYTSQTGLPLQKLFGIFCPIRVEHSRARY